MSEEGQRYAPESIEGFIEDQALLLLYDCLLLHPLPPSPVRKLSLFLSLPVCRRVSLVMGEGGRGEKAWSSVNNSVLSGSHSTVILHYLTQKQVFLFLEEGFQLRKIWDRSCHPPYFSPNRFLHQFCRMFQTRSSYNCKINNKGLQFCQSLATIAVLQIQTGREEIMNEKVGSVSRFFSF
jgi:hypothetical protein